MAPGGHPVSAAATSTLAALRELAEHRGDLDARIDTAILQAVEAGASIRQIAEALGVNSPGTITSRLRRIRDGRNPGHRKDATS